jgi:hypothetical protein
MDYRIYHALNNFAIHRLGGLLTRPWILRDD